MSTTAASVSGKVSHLCGFAQVTTRVGAVLPLWLGDPLTGRTGYHELWGVELWAGDTLAGKE